MNEEERLQILEMIEKGVITASEGVRLLNSLQGEPEEGIAPQISDSSSAAPQQPWTTPEPEVVDQPVAADQVPPSAEFEAGINKWRRWWWIPLSVGIGITVISGLLMYMAYESNGFGFWFACLWFPLLFGILIISLAATSRTARWLHVRIQQAPGERPQNIRISLPLPIRFTAWIFRIFRPHIHGMDNINMDEVLHSLEKVSPEQPFYVKVDEDESGEKVEVYIG